MKHLQLFLLIFVVAFGCTIYSQNKNILSKLRTIELPKVEGRIDHLSMDIKSNKLFIAALGNGSIEIVDLKSGEVANRISELDEPQGVLYYDKSNSLFVASAGDGTCKIFSVSDFKLIKTIKLGDDADNIRYDKKRNIVFVGFGSGGVAAIDPVEMKLIYEIDLPAHPESFQIDESKDLMFVNVPDAGQLDVININERKILEKINLKVRGNFPMALDTDHQVIFIGSRNPSKLVLFDANSLKMISEKDISGDADDIFYDHADSLVFVSCGSGNIDIFKQKNKQELNFLESVNTSPGARTSLYVSALNRLFIAARKYDGNNARIFEFSIHR